MPSSLTGGAPIACQVTQSDIVGPHSGQCRGNASFPEGSLPRAERGDEGRTVLRVDVKKGPLGHYRRSDTLGVDKYTRRMIDTYAAGEFKSLLQRTGLADADGKSFEVAGSANGNTYRFIILAVSGTLEEGFPLRGNLDFREHNEFVPAIFLGSALIRGVKSHLDIKPPGCREFQLEPGMNPVNPAMVVTGDKNDANIYSVYAVERRQAVQALLNEPRFLAMTPDTVLADLNCEETTQAVKNLIWTQIQTDAIEEPVNTAEAALLTVVAVWKSPHFLPSPVLYTKDDGTRVTDFPNSLAKFAGISDRLRIEDPAGYQRAIQRAVRSAAQKLGEEGIT